MKKTAEQFLLAGESFSTGRPAGMVGLWFHFSLTDLNRQCMTLSWPHMGQRNS
jgi:hypothetical protein